MSGPFRHEAAGWSPLESAVDDEPAVRSRRGPSLLFAVTVIAGVAMVTAGAVAMFAIEPSEGAPEQKGTVASGTVAADKSAVTASLEPSIPVHKVTTLPVPAARAPADLLNKPQTAVSETVDTEDLDALQAQKDASQDVDALQQQDPRWARSDSEKSATAFDSVLQPSTPAGGDAAAAGTGALALADPSPTDVKKTVEGAETAAIAPEDLKPKQTAKVKPTKPAEPKVDDDNSDLPPGVSSSVRTVQITKGANMRSRPKSGSSVLAVVPKGAAVQLVSCSAWCEIIYDGRRGYVYKNFIGGAGRGGSAAKSTKTKTVFTVDAKQPETTTTSSTQPKSTVKPISSRLQ